jgi:predicted regulator of Ras-like GTPase activity (Roadblock/LC7/MglB family)
MKEILNQINEIAGVKGSLVVDNEGLVIASNLMSGMEERTISAMVAGIYQEIIRAIRPDQGSELSGVQLTASEGSIIFLCAPECILTVITEPGANIGLVSIKMKASLERLMKIL